MGARLVYSLVLLATPAFAGSKVDPTGAPDAEALRGTVLVWHDAQLFTEPSDTARSLTLATFKTARKDRTGHVVAMRVVAPKSTGAFVEVELTSDEDCTWSHIDVPDDITRVRLFVRRADIAPVLAKPYTKTFADGTSITLGVGTPLAATDAGTYVVSLRGDELEVDVPAASVGHSYTLPKAGGPIGRNIAGTTLAIKASTKAVLGTRYLSLGAWKGSPVERRGETAIVALEDRCASATVAVSTAALSDVDESTIEVGGSSDSNSSMMNLRDEYLLPKLTPLQVGTRVVAVAAKHIYLHSEPSGKNACIQRRLTIESAFDVEHTDERLRVCAPATKVAREVTRSARRASR